MTQTVTVPKTVDTVKITRAELVVKILSLRVEPTSTSPTATLTQVPINWPVAALKK